MSSVDNSIGQGGDFQKGATVTGNVYDTSPSGLGILPAYLAPGASVSATSTTTVSGTSGGVVVPLASWPPGSPSDGEYVFLELPSTYDPVGGKKIRWAFVYNTADTVWDFVGGPSLYANIDTLQTVGSVTYTDLGTVGPAIATPRAGDYLVDVGAQINSTAVANIEGFMAYSGAGITAADTDAATAGTAVASAPVAVYMRRYKSGLTAATITAKYRAGTASDAQFASRWIGLTPVRIT